MTTDITAAVQPGLQGEKTVQVAEEHTINRTRKPDGAVLSTPSMIMLMELAAIEAVDPKLPKGHATVGFHVDVKHFGAAAIGEEVRAEAKVTAVDGNKISLEVAAFAGEKQIGAGSHRRAVIGTD